jgi:hypothetical protein
MKPKFTPGPWFACVGDHPSVNPKTTGPGGHAFRLFPHLHLGERDHDRTYVSADGSTCSATCSAMSRNITFNESGTIASCDADALLASAAPLGYALAVAVLETPTNTKRLMDLAREFLAKARGEKP